MVQEDAVSQESNNVTKHTQRCSDGFIRYNCCIAPRLRYITGYPDVNMYTFYDNGRQAGEQVKCGVVRQNTSAVAAPTVKVGDKHCLTLATRPKRTYIGRVVLHRYGTIAWRRVLPYKRTIRLLDEYGYKTTASALVTRSAYLYRDHHCKTELFTLFLVQLSQCLATKNGKSSSPVGCPNPNPSATVNAGRLSH